MHIIFSEISRLILHPSKTILYKNFLFCYLTFRKKDNFIEKKFFCNQKTVSFSQIKIENLKTKIRLALCCVAYYL